MNLFKDKLILAPMAGITDSTFRTLCRKNGADVVVSEMVSADGIFYGGKKTLCLLAFEKPERPIGIQLFGSSAQRIAHAAQYVEEHISPDFIDLNSGCPVPKVVTKNGGAALLKNRKLYTEIVASLTKAVSVPVTVKLRCGWTKDDLVDVDYAKIAQDHGAAAVTLHARTKTMGFSGQALWDRIALLKSSVSIPVIGNGDVISPELGVQMFKQTGCDSIMIGRGAYGNPWIFSQTRQLMNGIHYRPVDCTTRLTTALIHLRRYAASYGEPRAIREMKKHLAWYIKGMPGAAESRNALFRAQSTAHQEEIITRLLSGL